MPSAITERRSSRGLQPCLRLSPRRSSMPVCLRLSPRGVAQEACSNAFGYHRGVAQEACSNLLGKHPSHTNSSRGQQLDSVKPVSRLSAKRNQTSCKQWSRFGDYIFFGQQEVREIQLPQSPKTSMVKHVKRQTHNLTLS